MITDLRYLFVSLLFNQEVVGVRKLVKWRLKRRSFCVYYEKYFLFVLKAPFESVELVEP